MKNRWKMAGVMCLLVVGGLWGNPGISAASDVGVEVDDEEENDSEAIHSPRCNVLGRADWTKYGSGKAGCNAACADLCGIPTGRIQTVWFLCICGS